MTIALQDILSDDKRAGVCKCLMSHKVGLISKEAKLGVYISAFSVAKAIKPKYDQFSSQCNCRVENNDCRSSIRATNAEAVDTMS